MRGFFRLARCECGRASHLCEVLLSVLLGPQKQSCRAGVMLSAHPPPTAAAPPARPPAGLRGRELRVRVPQQLRLFAGSGVLRVGAGPALPGGCVSSVTERLVVLPRACRPFVKVCSCRFPGFEY